MTSVQGHGGWVLEADHDVLESLITAVITAVRRDPHAVGGLWRVFERHLLHHLDVEEMLVFPVATLDRSADVEWLRAEHSGIRASVGELSMAVDAESALVEPMEGLAARLRAHEHREHEWLYRWTDHGLDASRNASIARRIRAAWKRTGHVVRHRADALDAEAPGLPRHH